MPGFISAVSPGVTVPIGATRLYYICFLTGVAISATTFVALNYIFPAKKLKAYVNDSQTWREARIEFRDRWDALADASAGLQPGKGEDREIEVVQELPKTTGAF
jgi:nucleobase:cation symporter-1, NCS1 family